MHRAQAEEGGSGDQENEQKAMTMNRDALGDLPEPKPLYDPLLAGRQLLLGLLVVSLAVGLWRLIPDSDVVYWIAFGVGLVVQLAFLYALPRRPVDALYLRAFGVDDASFDARLLVEATLYPEFRLSGIRAPRRRMPLIVRPLLFGLFAMRYLGIRYMSLEAESDWQARLWKSLSVVRVVIIDLRQVTPHLIAEIELSLRCVGLERMLFVCDADSVNETLANLAASFGQGAEALEKRTVVWRGGDAADIERFMADVESCKNALPAEPAGLRWDAFELVREYAMDRRTAVRRTIADGAQWAIGIALVLYMQLVDPETLGRAFMAAMSSPVVRIILSALSGVIIVPAFVAIVALFRRRPLERAVRRRSRGVLLRSFAGTTRTLTIASLAVGLGIHGGIEVLTVAVEGKLADARIVMAKSQLHTLRNEIDLYYLNTGRYPSGLGDLAGSIRDSRLLIDPWGGEFEFDPLATEQRLWSRGPDGISGSEDDVYLD